MKVTIKSVIKTSHPNFDCFEDQQIIFRAGNTLCIKQIGKPDSQFISLNQHMDKLLEFKATSNKKGVFTAEKSGKQIELAMYTLAGQRKTVLLSLESAFLAQVQKIQLLIDEFDNSLLYGVAKGKQSYCVFLADFNKNKLLSVGYLPVFDDIKVDSRQNMTLSVCGNNGNFNYIKCLQYGSGKWQISEQIFKKIPGTIFQHQLLLGGRKLMIGKRNIYILQDNQLSKTIDLTQEKDLILTEVIKIPKGLLLRLSNNTFKLMVDDHEELSFVMVGNVQLTLTKGHTLFAVRVSNNNEQVWVRTDKNDLFVWRCDNIGTDISPAELVFNKVDSNCSMDNEGSVSLSAQKQYALLAGGNSVVLWGLQKAQVVLSTQFRDPVDKLKRTVLAGSINPDGNSIMLAFQDKIKIYKILFTKFKFYHQFPIKRVQEIIYSHGGQLAACRFGKGQNSCVIVYNLLRLTELYTFKIQAEPTQIFFNELDDELYVVTENNSIQIFRMSEYSRIHNLKFDEQVNYARIDNRTKKLMVSTPKKIYLIDAGKIVDNFEPPIKQFSYIFPLYGAYFIVATNGVLYYCANIRFQKVIETTLFDHKPFKILCKSNNLVAFSSFSDIINLRANKKIDSSLLKKRDDVVLIEKEQICLLFDKMKQIQSRFEMLSSTYTIKVEQEKQNYQRAAQILQFKYKEQVKFANQHYQSLSSSKLRQQKQSENMFQNLQHGQVRNVDQIERMYERKVKMQRQKIMTMQQQTLVQKIKYQDVIYNLQKKYHRDIENIRKEYSTKLKQQNCNLDKMKHNNLQAKKRIEMKLLDVQEENQITLREIQLTKDTIIDQLRIDQIALMEGNQQAQIQIQTKNQNIEKMKTKVQIGERELARMEAKVSEVQNRVRLLEKDIAGRNKMVQERDHIIKQQAHQIGDLQKAKYVLSFRTTQIRKQMQPKQAMVDKLKSQLIKLDQQYKQLKRKNYNLDQKLEKMQTISNITKRQNSDLKIQLRYKERMHDELSSQIFMVINTVDPKDWNGQFIKIYQNYIKQEKHKNRMNKKKDDTSEEINRHLMHVEESLMQVTYGTDRIMKGKDKEVIRKMKQNSQLVYQLNVMRKKQNQFAKEKKELVNQNSRLKRELSETAKSTTRTQTAHTGHRKFIVSRDYTSKDKHATLDVSDMSTSKRDTREIKKDKTRLASARRTLMLQDDIKQKSGKFFDLAKQLQGTRRQLQTTKKTVMLQQSQIQQLNQRLFSSVELP